MDSEKRKSQIVNNVIRKFRTEDKLLENSKKAPLVSDDVKETKDYVFSPIRPGDRIGDSGQLLLAKRKKDRKERYLIKHAYCDCAANEFVYTKLAQAMDTKMPDAVLFQLSEGEKRNYFKTEYIIGTFYLDLSNESPSYALIREQAKNWQDFFRFYAMYNMFLEGDSFEILLASDGYIYRVDTTDSFPMSELYLSQAGVNKEFGGFNLKEMLKQQFLTASYENCWDHINFNDRLLELTKRYGKECEKPYLEPFKRIQEIPNDYVEDFLNTLCYFYPDFIGDYFKLFITALQKMSHKYLQQKR